MGPAFFIVSFKSIAYTLSRLQSITIAAALCLLTSCATAPGTKTLDTENVIIVVIDGVRNSETWAHTPGHIPNMSGTLKRKCVFVPGFRNEGYTYTNSGHTAITTAVNQPIDNYGSEYPDSASIFQYWLKQTGKPATSAWIISSKDKLNILANTKDSTWQNTFMPSLNAGKDGPGSGYRADSLTLLEVKKVLANDKPNLVLVNFMEPDGYAHAGNWNNYLRGITRNDRYVKQLYDYLQQDPHYKNKTTLLITTDHGRHLDGVENGWIEHGDACEGCRAIFLLALGPDFKKGSTIENNYTLTDIPVTAAFLLGIEFRPRQGNLMLELFKKKKLRRLGL